MFGFKIRIGSTKAPDQTIEILVPILDNDSKFGEAELRVKNPGEASDTSSSRFRIAPHIKLGGQPFPLYTRGCLIRPKPSFSLGKMSSLD